jgi:uncharacterized protein YbaR (Trm112 family)
MTPTLSYASTSATTSNSSIPVTVPTTPSDGIPRCIPLHGTLSTLYCPHCSRTFPIDQYLPIFASGTTLACPSCEEVDALRSAVGERSRGVGRLKPDVVLYGETHKEGERIGDITRRDLMGQRPDLLIVVGTSLKVPGTKKLVRELSKVIRPPRKERDEDVEEDYEMPAASGSTTVSNSTRGGTASPSKRRRATPTTKPDPVHVIFLNAEFPSSASEWKNVFDVWCRGDVQEFVAILNAEKLLEEERQMKKRIEKEEALERKMERQRIKTESPAVKSSISRNNVAAKPSRSRSSSSSLSSTSSITATNGKSGSVSVAMDKTRSSGSRQSLARGKGKATVEEAGVIILPRTKLVRGNSDPIRLTQSFQSGKSSGMGRKRSQQ